MKWDGGGDLQSKVHDNFLSMSNTKFGIQDIGRIKK